MKTARELIKDIRIWEVNVKQIAESEVINGSLLIDLENKFEEYAAQFQSQWIKINSEADLPEELTSVLIHSSSMGIILAYHHKSAWRVPLEVREGERAHPDDDEFICSTKSKSITDYMVLPQKPKED